MAAMTKAVAELPDEVDALKAIIVAMADTGGGRTWANVATLLQTAKMNDVARLAHADP